MQRLSAPANYSNTGSAITVDSQGNVYVTGSAYNPAAASHDYVTIKYAADGTQFWIRFYDGPGKSSDGAKAITVDVQGNVYVTGISYGGTVWEDHATVKYRADGQRLWARTYNGMANRYDYAAVLAMDQMDRVHVVGYTELTASNSDYFILKHNDSKQAWLRTYNGTANEWDSAQAVAVDSQGNVYVTGSSEGSGNVTDCVTLKYNSAGTKLWESRYKRAKPIMARPSPWTARATSMSPGIPLLRPAATTTSPSSIALEARC